MAIRVLIADDHRLTMQAIKDVLTAEQGFRIVGVASSGRQALAHMTRAKPDAAVIDLHMPGEIDGLTCAERIRKHYPDVKVLIISAFGDDESIRMAFRRGAHAFISKDVDPRDLPAAVRQTVRGTVYHQPPDLDKKNSDLAGLTDRELAVLKSLSTGSSNREIAEGLWVTEHTVKFHLTNIFRKLEVSNRTGAAKWAHQRGLVGGLRAGPLTLNGANGGNGTNGAHGPAGSNGSNGAMTNGHAANSAGQV